MCISGPLGGGNNLLKFHSLSDKGLSRRLVLKTAARNPDSEEQNVLSGPLILLR